MNLTLKPDYDSMTYILYFLVKLWVGSQDKFAVMWLTDHGFDMAQRSVKLAIGMNSTACICFKTFYVCMSILGAALTKLAKVKYRQNFHALL